MPTDVLIGMAVTWLLTGIVTGIVMRRQGHDLFVWLALGSVLGPLVVPLAVDNARSIKVAQQASHARPGPPAEGLDLLLAIDGSPAALHAAKSAVAMFGSMATSVTVATVLDFEAETSATGKDDQMKAQELLDDVAGRIRFPNIETKILFGRPDVALAEHARVSGTELIVVGPRGHGASETIFGSVTKNLVAGGSVPVFVGTRTVDTSRPLMEPD